MTGAAFLLSAVGMLYAWETDRPGLLILSFWVFLIAFAMAMSRDAARNEAVREREALLRLHDEFVREAAPVIPDSVAGALAFSLTPESLQHWPTAAPGTFPEEEAI